jgi:primosomal protein N'
VRAGSTALVVDISRDVPSDPRMSFVLVALPLPVRRSFLYRVPEALRERVRPGAPVEVPVRGRLARGVVIERVACSGIRC